VTPQLLQIALLCAPLIHPLTLGAIVAVESGGNPFAVSVNYPQAIQAQGLDLPDLSTQPRSVAEASRLVEDLTRQGFSTSLGLAQISTEHLQEFSLSSVQLFDPCTNLRLAERILLRCKQQVAAAGPTATPTIARILSCYNSGNQTLGLHNGYVNSIIAHALILNHPPAKEGSSDARP
jgi:type IV secretion system protein VirB1